MLMFSKIQIFSCKYVLYSSPILWLCVHYLNIKKIMKIRFRPFKILIFGGYFWLFIILIIGCNFGKFNIMIAFFLFGNIQNWSLKITMVMFLILDCVNLWYERLAWDPSDHRSFEGNNLEHVKVCSERICHQHFIQYFSLKR